MQSISWSNLMLLLLTLCAPFAVALETSDFYEYDKAIRLEHGVDKYEFVSLDTPVHFFSDVVDHVYLNTKGILTIGVELQNFLNIPFPLDNHAIAPFYSNIDTTNAGPETAITLSKLNSPINRRRATELVRRQFAGARNFEALNVTVATWENVGRYKANNELQNTFQVAIIAGAQDTFVQFLYPSNGLNWIQGELGESGLPDVRAQAGFVSEDGRFFALKGSGTDNVKHLTQFSNIDEPGSWLFWVGHLSYEENIREPDNVNSSDVKASEARTCADGGNLKCHIAATCVDGPTGFCCKCRAGYYGNGFNCLKADVPLRVSGKITGSIGDVQLDSQLQSYVVLSDGRSYTAISPLSKDVGYKSQLLFSLGNAIGWLFAKPNGNNATNGYQITGGKLNHTTLLRFEASGDQLIVEQKFNGLNVWDQLSVDVSIKGTTPVIPPGASIVFPEITDEYVFQSDTTIRSSNKIKISVEGQQIDCTIEQTILFEKCPHSPSDTDLSPASHRVTKITAQYQERETALRIGMINRIVGDTAVNRCNDGSVICGENTVCIPDVDHDTYSCECKNGYALVTSVSPVTCADINECEGTNICDPNAECFNELGGYSCRCRNGFFGNGYTCEATQVTPRPSYVDVTTVRPEATSNVVTGDWSCEQCSEHAECLQGVCVCKNGWNGDGVDCNYNCEADSVWNIDRCMPISGSDEEDREVAPFCYNQGCSCPTGYDLVETSEYKICRINEQLVDERLDDDDDDEDDKLPCDANYNCHVNASCEWVESEQRKKCICNYGFEGNGFDCVEHEDSCLFTGICNQFASCVYDEVVGKSLCKCNKGWEGDGKTCNPAPECATDDDCAQNSQCSDGVCVCKSGFERDIADLCVPSGYCGGAYCAENAVCQWDNVEHISYCLCPEGYVGDGVNTCKSVPPPCNVRNICGLNAQCLPDSNTGKYECKCNAHFYGDGFICVPEINCVNVPNLCHANATCVSTSNGYQCVCATGYVGNGTHCSLPYRLESTFLLSSQGLAILKLPLSGQLGLPIAMASMAIGVDKDCSLGRVYWSDISTKQIYSSNYNGTDKKTFIDTDILSPEGVAVDWISRRLYWADSAKDTIEVAALDNATIRAVVIRKGLVNPRGIAVDPHQSKLYWSDWNRDEPKIEWSNLDGTEREVLLSSPSVSLPNSLAISQRTGEVCFADAGTSKIECIETYRKLVRTIAANVSYPFGLAVTSDRFFWSDWTTKKVESSDEHGNRLPSLSTPIFGQHKMYGLTAITDECPLFHSQCQINNGDCPKDRICLVNLRAPSGRSCFETRPSVDQY